MKDDNNVIPLFPESSSYADAYETDIQLTFDTELNRRLDSMVSDPCAQKKTEATTESESNKRANCYRVKFPPKALKNYLIGLLEHHFKGKSPLEDKLKNAIANWFMAQVVCAFTLLLAFPNIADPTTFARTGIFVLFFGVLFCMYKMLENRKQLEVLKTMRQIMLGRV
jgi:hypothetical protein